MSFLVDLAVEITSAVGDLAYKAKTAGQDKVLLTAMGYGDFKGETSGQKGKYFFVLAIGDCAYTLGADDFSSVLIDSGLKLNIADKVNVTEKNGKTHVLKPEQVMIHPLLTKMRNRFKVQTNKRKEAKSD